MVSLLKRAALACAFAFLSILAPFAHATESTGVVVSQNFTGTTAEILNPERSWYEWSSGSNGYLISYNGSTYGGVTSGGLASSRSAGYSMVLGLIDLSQFRTTTISSGFLTELSNRFATVRASGEKVVVRPVYNYDNNGADASMSVILGHIGQLKQIMRDNADVIAYAQAGFFGPYGEMWEGSSSTSRSAADRVTLRDALLAAWHPRTTISWRYPANVITFWPSAMTLALHTTGAGQSRTGVFNDCFLSNEQDTGTYSSLTDSKRTRVATDSTYVPFGGETCNYSNSTSRKTCSDILSEGARYHLAYLNRSYDGSFYSAWTSGGCYAQVMRSMGYRFVLDSISHQSTANVGQTITAFVYMHDEGWSRIFSPRRLVVRLRNTSGTVVAAGTSYYDLRLLPPQSTTQQQIPVTITVPTSGTLNLEICMPDRWPSLASDVRYSVRPANANSPGSWNGTTGCFVTGTSVIGS